jgi:hypothetical protein
MGAFWPSMAKIYERFRIVAAVNGQLEIKRRNGGDFFHANRKKTVAVYNAHTH